MTSQLLTKYQLQMKPRPGQFLVYIDLSMVQSRSKAETLTELERLGYAPQLRFLETPSGEVKLYALLRDEQHDPTQRIPDTYLREETIALFEAFPGEATAIYSLQGVPKPQAIAA